MDAGPQDSAPDAASRSQGPLPPTGPLASARAVPRMLLLFSAGAQCRRPGVEIPPSARCRGSRRFLRWRDGNAALNREDVAAGRLHDRARAALAKIPVPTDGVEPVCASDACVNALAIDELE